MDPAVTVTGHSTGSGPVAAVSDETPPSTRDVGRPCASRASRCRRSISGRR